MEEGWVESRSRKLSGNRSNVRKRICWGDREEYRRHQFLRYSILPREQQGTRDLCVRDFTLTLSEIARKIASYSDDSEFRSLNRA
jgi:hypothetical protein